MSPLQYDRQIDGVLDHPGSSPEFSAYRAACAALDTRAPHAPFCRIHQREEAGRLAQSLPPPEITRWDADAFVIDRAYWRNSIAVRVQLGGLPEACGTDAGFLRFLRRLHVIYLMGGDFKSAYVPISDAVRRALCDPARGPGALRQRRIRCGPKSPRAMAYYLRLEESIPGCASARGAPFPAARSGGLSWGQCLLLQETPDRPERRHFFVPPDAILPAHVSALREAFCASWRARQERNGKLLEDELAHFLQLFVRLHPFEAGNFGLVMNIVNWILRDTHHGYLPHLHLDWCAHRLGRAGFAVLFGRAIGQLLVSTDPDQSLDEVAGRIARLKRELDDDAVPTDEGPAEAGDFGARIDALLA